MKRPSSFPIIYVPSKIATVIRSLSQAVGGQVILVGGWAVHCRLRMGRSISRATEDLDVLLTQDLRPAAEALEAIKGVQDDSQHPCRLSGLPLVVDLLADSHAAIANLDTVHGGVITDLDGLRLVVPPFARLLTTLVEPVVLESRDESILGASINLPRAGALFATKVGNLALDDRKAKKRARDGEDALRLLTTFGSAALLADLASAQDDEREALHRLLSMIEASGLVAQARVSGYEPEEARIRAAVAQMCAGLHT